MDEYISYEEEF